MITTYQFNGEPSDTQSILSKPELQGKYVIAVRFSRWTVEEGEPPNIIKVDKGGRIDVDVSDTPIPIIYKTKIHATDFLVSTPKINSDPEKALDEAIAEMEKGEGNPKSITLITLSLAKYLKSKKNKLK